MKFGGFVGLSIILAAACTGSDPTATTAGTSTDGGLLPDGAAANGVGQLVLDDVTLSAAPAKKVTVHLKVERNGVAGVLDIASPDAPIGVTVEPLQIAADASEGDLVVDATTGAVQARTKVTLRATIGGALAATRPVDLVVRGAAGTLDRTTATSGTFTPAITHDKATNVAVDGQGRIFVITSDCKLARHLPTGAVDDLFKAPSLTATDDPFKTALVRPTCGPIAIRGTTLAIAGSVLDSDDNSYAMVFRLDLDGHLLPAPLYKAQIGNVGRTRMVDAVVGGVALDEDGTARLAVDALGDGTGTHELQLVGMDGNAKPLADQFVLKVSFRSSWTMLADGRARFLTTASSQFFDAGFDKDGKLDPLVGPGGMSTSPGHDTRQLPSGGSQYAHASTIDASGRALVAGLYVTSNATRHILDFASHGLGTAATPNGPWVDPFAGSLRDVAAAPSASSPHAYSAIAVDPSTGLIVTAGIDDAGPFVSRFDANGFPDTSFGSNGIAHFPDVSATNVASFGALLLQSDGGIVVFTNDSSNPSMLRFWL